MLPSLSRGLLLRRILRHLFKLFLKVCFMLIWKNVGQVEHMFELFFFDLIPNANSVERLVLNDVCLLVFYVENIYPASSFLEVLHY
jgi:hypothetical protein